MADHRANSTRLEGLDFARFLAFFGMVLVNFKVATGATMEGAPSWLVTLHEALEGRAAALFVLLAGIGIGLGARRALQQENLWPARQKLLIRGAILFAFGMLNMLVFEADILHFYGLYFVFAILFLCFNVKGLLISAVVLILSFPLVALLADYDQGWNWVTLTYSDFWTIPGFLRHSLVNGWHPVVPWLGFLLVGMAIARLDLKSHKVRATLAGIGAALMLFAWLLVWGITTGLAEDLAADAELADAMLVITSTIPIPPSPAYMMTSTGSALILLSLSLWLGDLGVIRKLFQPAMAAGRQALTLYIVHIFVGMGILEAMGMIAVDASESAASLWQASIAALVFTAAAMLYAILWQKWLGQGPLERVLRLLSR